MANWIRTCEKLCVLLLSTCLSTLTFAADLSDPSIAVRNFQQLRALLPTYQYAVSHPWPTVATNRLLKMGMHNSAIPTLRVRLIATNDLPAKNTYRNDDYFDKTLQQGVMVFQQRHGLKADGIVGPNTLSELNVPPAERVKQIAVNMQRWAELAQRMGNRFIMVNVPDFNLSVYDNNKKVLSMRAIVGRPTRQTPELSSRVTRIVFNPYWNVPDMIAKKDVIPKEIKDPDYLDDMHIKVYDHSGDDAEQLNEDDINWQQTLNDVSAIHLRQEPGKDNALGLVKFEFQNSDDVYLHDTPAKNLFAEDVRTFSSGCVRLQNPFALVDYLMQKDPEWNKDRMQALLDTNKTHYVSASQPTPIFITYITAWVDEDGTVNFRNDIYDRDDPQDGDHNKQGQDESDE